MLKFQNHFIFYFLCIAFTSLELELFLLLPSFILSAFLLFHSNLPFLLATNEPVGEEGKDGRNGQGKNDPAARPHFADLVSSPNNRVCCGELGVNLGWGQHQRAMR